MSSERYEDSLRRPKHHSNAANDSCDKSAPAQLSFHFGRAPASADCNNCVCEEPVEPGSHRKAICAHHSDLDPVAFCDIVGERKRRTENIIRIACRPENSELTHLTIDRAAGSNDARRPPFLRVPKLLQRSKDSVIYEQRFV